MLTNYHDQGSVLCARAPPVIKKTCQILSPVWILVEIINKEDDLVSKWNLCVRLGP